MMAYPVMSINSTLQPSYLCTLRPFCAAPPKTLWPLTAAFGHNITYSALLQYYPTPTLFTTSFLSLIVPHLFKSIFFRLYKS